MTEIIEKQGPTLPISKEIHTIKYRGEGESFREAMSRIANTLADDPQHFKEVREILLDMRKLPGGRIQSAIGSPRRITAFNCFVMDTLPDSMEGIMRIAAEAAETMRLGGGVGYDFSTLRPRGDLIVSLDSRSSGPISFMGIFDALCKTISSAGHRRGAQMGVLRVDHPDIEEFIKCKQNHDKLTQFNLSISITDKFIEAVLNEEEFELQFDGKVYKKIDARALWNEIMRSTWDWAEPGILYIDRINEMNNLWYCEKITTTNPCAEQPLPPYGACLLGSFNLVKYLRLKLKNPDVYRFDWDLFKQDIQTMVPAMDNVIEKTYYPLEKQRQEAISKRRMGLGVTGLANAGEALGNPYGSEEFLKFTSRVMKLLSNTAYQTSALLAKKKGSFPLYHKERYLESKFIRSLTKETRDLIEEYGIRNSHLISIAPTGTISLSADNVSSGCEPVFNLWYDRTIQNFSGATIERVEDYGYRVLGTEGKTSEQCSVQDHLAVLTCINKYVDSSVSKTLNVGDDVTWEDFKEIYMDAWKAGCKGATTFRAAGKRYGILNKPEEEEEVEEEGVACYYDEKTGLKTCE